MTAWELVTVLVAIAALGVVMALSHLVIKLLTTKIQNTVELAAGRLEEQAHGIEREYHRVDGLIDTAEKITSRANFVSGLTYSIFTKPITQVASMLKGGIRLAKVLALRLFRSQIKT